MKNVKISQLTLLSYEVLYGDSKFDVVSSLKLLPKNSSLELVSFLLHKHNLRKRDNPRFQSDQLFAWMMQMFKDEQQLIIKFAQTHNRVISSFYFLLIDRSSCLNLQQNIIVHCNENDDSLKPTDHSILFKCLLYFNSEVNDNQKSIFNWDNTGNAQEFENNILPLHFKNIDLNTFRDYRVQALKVYHFFKFCETDPKYSLHLANFLKALEIENYRSYFWRIFNQMHLLVSNEEETTKVHIDGDKNYLSFFNSLSINNEIKETHPDFLHIRQFPLYKLDNNKFLYLDYRLFVDKFYQSFLFDFAKHAELNFGTFRSDMGENFSEKFLFYRTMEKCFGNFGHKTLNGKQLKDLLQTAEPDYYIRDGSKVFMFEFKDVLMNWEVKQSRNVWSIKEAIINKFEKSKAGQNKGISQLKNSITNFKKGVYLEAKVDEINPDSATIYPVLVHTDLTLEAYGVNRFINERFKDLFKEIDLRRYRIKKVTVLHLDTLIQLQDFFRSGRLKLATCINAYLDYISRKDPVSENFPFDEFVKYYLGKKNRKNRTPIQDFENIISELQDIN
jgi:hypothetical protein